MDSKYSFDRSWFNMIFCFAIQKVTWNALSAGVFSVETLLLRSRFCVITLLFFEKTAAEKRATFLIVSLTNEQTDDVSETA